MSNIKYNDLIRWFLLLPLSLLISLIVGKMADGSGTGFYLLKSFVRSFFLITSAYYIAPKYNFKIASILGVLWILIVPLLTFGFSYLNLFDTGDKMQSVFFVILSVIGSLTAILYCKTQNDENIEEGEIE